MDHVAGVGKTNAVTAGMRFDDRSRVNVGFFSRPIALKLEQDLQPGLHRRTRRLHSAQRKVMRSPSSPTHA
ncbi:hypothetical protein ACC771_09835, partial [Rhizobium ruizarguesonis]